MTTSKKHLLEKIKINSVIPLVPTNQFQFYEPKTNNNLTAKEKK